MSTTPSNPVQSCQPMTGCLSAEDREALDTVFIAHLRSQNATLTARIAELEANERAYESIVGPMTYQEVSDQFANYAIRIEELETALRFIADGYDNHDVNHLDYRVKVYQVALDVLEPKGAAV